VYDFWGEVSGGRIGEWGRVREFADLGDRTVEGLGGWWGFVALEAFGRFLGFGIGWV